MTLGEVLEDYITAKHPVENITICMDKLHRVSYENALIHSLGKPSYKKNGKNSRFNDPTSRQNFANASGMVCAHKLTVCNKTSIDVSLAL